MSASNPSKAPAIRPYGAAAIAEAADLILAGGLVAIPTETVYGLAADATDSQAVAGIYAAKGRPSFNPLIVHVADLSMAESFACFDETSQTLARRFWPGPLTLVLPLIADAGIAPLVTAGLDSIAIRCPAHAAMQDLIAASGRPLAAPSANRSGGISPTRATHVAASLGARVPLILDAGPTQAGLESTIVKAAPGHIVLLRPGPFTAAMLTEATSLPVRTSAADAGIESPGQLASHYAPTAPVRLDVPPEQRSPESWYIGFDEAGGDDLLSASGDLREAAANLFSALHRADASGRPLIEVAPVPGEGLGAAINDRLRRAAAPR